jgi:hypothetical protein
VRGDEVEALLRFCATLTKYVFFVAMILPCDFGLDILRKYVTNDQVFLVMIIFFYSNVPHATTEHVDGHSFGFCDA